MKNLILSGFLFISSVGFSQHYFGLQLGGTYPINYTANELTRKVGIEAGFIYEKNINNQLSFETGLVVDIYGRINNEVVYQYSDAEGNYYDTLSNEPFLRLSLQIPLLLKYKLKNEKVLIYSGLNLAARNWLSFTNYTGLDAEIGNASPSDAMPVARAYGFDFAFGVDYCLKQNLILYLNFRTPVIYYQSTNYDYGMLSAGIKYHFGGNR